MRINKRNATIFTLAIALVFLTISFFTPGGTYQVRTFIKPMEFYSVFNRSATAINPIIRVHNGDTDEFECSAVVIDFYHALTAAHCAVGRMNRIKLEPFKIYSVDGEFITGSVVEGLDLVKDSAILRGDFRRVFSEKADFKGEIPLRIGDTLKVCGYPTGQKEIYCFETQFQGNNNFRYRLYGPPLIKGMSGGPVYHGDTVIGVNSAVDTNFCLAAPIIGLQVLTVEPK